MAAQQDKKLSPSSGEPAGAEAPSAEPGRRRSRRSTVAPATLARAPGLLQTAPCLPPGISGSSDSATRQGSGGTSAGSPQHAAAAKAPATAAAPAEGILPSVAEEDDPRAWGDRPDDTADWLREQRPPHWG
ncbi:hypothetical protein LOC59_03445 [Arthrobacter sp. zg-Y916]|uniref:hypothetical protein n=1 Tax=Arthrobacter sp. zg-Y916 TaxID=2894190 RepID=UPI001E37499B|nr:hypothetical protein [Arthrobacter sp. zg-Y916]MCC9192710.1 hypothetical protein [Arthrobacter sp. zg-Y916]